MNMMRSILATALLAVAIVGCAEHEPKYGTETQLALPGTKRQVWAVAPAVNLSGQRVAINARVKGYHGPGNYTQEQLDAEGSSFGLTVDDKAYVESSDGSGAIVSTDANGGGTFYFEKLALANGGEMAGQITWTCKD